MSDRVLRRRGPSPDAAEADHLSLPEIGVRRILLIDDAIEVLDTPWWAEDERWAALIEGMRESLEEVLGVPPTEDLRQESDPDRRRAAFEPIRDAAGAAAFDGAVAKLDDGRDVTAQWVAELRARDAEVVLVKDEGNLDQMIEGAGGDAAAYLSGFDLVLLDYEFLPDDKGVHSTALAKRIKGTLQVDPASAPPLLVKFSRIPIEERETERAQFADEVGYPRGCYHFLAKSDVIQPSFEPVLRGVIENGKVGQRLYQVAAVVSQSIEAQARDRVAEMLIGRLDPTSARLMFDEQLRKEGMSELDYVVDLVAGVLAARARESPDVARAARAFLEALAAVPLEASPADTTSLATLEMELRFDTSVNQFRRPLGFGDLFLFEETDHLGLVVTRQSELMVRGVPGSNATTGPKIDWVSLALGRLVGDDEGSGPRFSPTGKPPFRRIEWDRTFATVSLPRAILDLTTLTDEGGAAVPRGAVHSEWWTTAFDAFVNAQIELVRGKLGRARAGQRQLTLHADGTASGEAVFGSGANLSAAADGTLRLRRVGRMRWTDTLARVQQILSDAGKIGALPDMDARRVRRSVEFHDGKRQVAEIEATETKVGSAVNLDVESSVLRARLAGLDAFATLAADTADYPGGYNVKASERLGYRPRWAGDRWQIWPPKAPASKLPIEGNASAPSVPDDRDPEGPDPGH